MSDDGHGSFVWYDLMTFDKGQALSFYPRITGWKTADWDQGDMDYTMWTAGEKRIGGVVEMGDDERQQGVPPHWLAYVSTPDIEATAQRVESLGGRVMHPPTEIPDTGRFAVIADPQGAVPAIYEPSAERLDQQPPGGSGPPEEGHFSWHELATTDWEAAFEFYSELFGWVGEAMDMGDAGMYQMYRRPGDDFDLGGMYNLTPDMEREPAWMYYARVPDVNRGAEVVQEAGGQILVGPMEVPGGDWIVQCLDPQGAAFALHHVTAEAGEN